MAHVQQETELLTISILLLIILLRIASYDSSSNYGLPDLNLKSPGWSLRDKGNVRFSQKSHFMDLKAKYGNAFKAIMASCSKSGEKS